MDSITQHPFEQHLRALIAGVGDESGVTAIEYALLAALIVIAVIAAISATGDSLLDLYVFWSSAVLAAL